MSARKRRVRRSSGGKGQRAFRQLHLFDDEVMRRGRFRRARQGRKQGLVKRPDPRADESAPGASGVAQP